MSHEVLWDVVILRCVNRWRRFGRGLLVLGCLWMVASQMTAAFPQQQEAEPTYSMDVRGLALDAALQRFMVATPIDLMYEPGLVTGKTSRCVAEDVPAEALLACIVQETGLQARRLPSGTYVVEPGARQPAPRAVVRGRVTSSEDGQPLPGVNIALRDTTGIVNGTATNRDGFFVLPRIPAGTYTLEARYVGFAPYAETLVLAPGQVTTKHIVLTPHTAELGEVVVEADEAQQGMAAVRAGLQRVRPRDIELVPAPDVSADLVSYLTALPGVVALGDRGGQLFIRGGEDTQNLVLLDGMPVYQPFHVVGFFSAFPAELVQQADVYAGGFGARYGGRLSSVIDVTARPGNKRRWEGSITLAPFVSGARLEGPILPGRLSVLASVRESVIEHGVARLIEDEIPFAFGDQFAKLHATITNSSQLSVTAVRTHDRGLLGLVGDEDGLDDATADQVSWRNEAYGLRYSFLPARLPVWADVVVAMSQIENELGPPDVPDRTSSLRQFSVASSLTYRLPRADVEAGLLLSSLALDNRLGGQFQNLDALREFVTEVGAYVEPRFRWGGGAFELTPGVRIHAFPSKSSAVVEPRLRGAMHMGRHTVSGAWGRYHQEIVGLNDRRDAGNVFTAWSAIPLGRIQNATHVLLSYHLEPSPTIQVGVEGFYKTFDNLSIPEWTAFPRFTTNLQPADGTARGVDVRLQWSSRWFFGFVTYGYAKVTYEAQGRSIPLWYGHDGGIFHPPHDRRHQVNALGRVTVLGADLSVRWQFGSGVPYSQAIGFDRFMVLHEDTDVTQQDGLLRVLYERPYQARLPAYHRLDLSLRRTFTLRHAAVTVQASAINLYDRANLFFMDLFTLRRVDQLPFIPSIGINVEVN